MHDKWENMRFVLAVVEHGSVSGAAQALSSDVETVEERCRSFEAMIGQDLFDKQGDRWAVANGALKIIASAREVMLSLQAGGDVADHSIDTLVIAASDTLCQHVLPFCLSALLQDNPRLQFSLVSYQGFVSLERLKADISIRPGRHLPSDFTGEAAVYCNFALYEARDCADCWLGFDRELDKSICRDWLDANVDRQMIVTRANSFMILTELAKQGQGRTLLPTFVGDLQPELIKTEIDLTKEKVPIYVACHRDMQENRRIRRAMSLLVTALRRDGRFLLN